MDEYPIWIGDAIMQAMEHAGWLEMKAVPSLPGTSQVVLKHVRHAPGVTTATLCRLCDTTRNAMDMRLARLEARGLIERSSDGGWWPKEDR